MSLEHCNKKNRAKDIIYLFDTDFFCGRVLKTGVCPICGTLLSELIETRKTDNKVFVDFETGLKAEKLINNEQTRIMFKKETNVKGRPYGWIYGDNREIKNNKGNIVEIRRYRCDFYGQKELMDTISIQ